MNTNVTKTDKSPIPAGMFGEGIEAFWYEGEKWVIANGAIMRYNEAPTKVKATIQRAFMNDRQSISYLAKMGYTKFSETFDKWYQCVVGGLDNIPDFENGKLKADAFNNMCRDANCPHRGRLCSRASGLKDYEVKTLSALKLGESIPLTAKRLCISEAGMKSRLNIIKSKLQAPNMAALMAKSVELGI